MWTSTEEDVSKKITSGEESQNIIISLMFLQGETSDPSDICLGNRYH